MGRGTSGETVGGSSLLYGAPTRRRGSVDVAVKVDRLVKTGDFPAAFEALAAVSQGRTSLDQEMEAAAKRIAVTQVLELYEQAPKEVMARLAENRGPEEEYLIERQTCYLGLAAMTGNEPPEDPRVHLYMWDQPKATIWSSPLCATLLPDGIRGRTVSSYMRDLPASHKDVMARLVAANPAEDVGQLGREIERGLLDSLLNDGDDEGFGGIEKRAQIVQKRLGRRSSPSPLTGPERTLISMPIRAFLHPLPGDWDGLREQVANGPALASIARFLKRETQGLALVEIAADEVWESLAALCLTPGSDEDADERITRIVADLRRERRSS